MIIPLFPLNLVLFPGSRVRLHIFEPRYKAMIGRCIEHGTHFGLVYVENDTVNTIGCTASVEEVTKRYSDGTFDIVVAGQARFEILGSEHTDEDLLIGEVQFIEDLEDLADPGEIRKAIALYNRLIRLAYKDKVPGIDSPEDVADVGMLSYQLAEKAGLELKKRQELLEVLSEKQRLTKVVRHIQQTLPVVEETQRMREVIMNDGYLPRVRG